MILRLIIALLLKIFILLGCYSFLRRFFRTRLETAIVSYLLSLVAQNVIYLSLSPFRWLTPSGIVWGYLTVGCVLFAASCICEKKGILCKPFEKLGKPTALDVIAVILFGALFIGLLLRPFFYFDTTDDALIQGMPKLAFIQQHRSLFVQYDSFTVNTFSNEWLGEMNALYYMLLAGEDIAAGFGNVEIYLFVALSYVYMVKAFGYRGKYRMPIAFAAATMPVLTGLAMTIKTDMISIALLPLTVALLLQYYRTESPALLFASILSVGATAASKISVLPGAGLLLIALVLFYFFKAKKRPVFPVAAGALGAVFLCDRYVLNLIQYGNPFQRALNEKMSFSFVNLKNSLAGCFGEFFETEELLETMRPWSASNWVLTKGMGYFGIACLLLFVAACVAWGIRCRKEKLDKMPLLLIALPIVAGFLFFCTSSVWYNWSFRYVVPYVMVAYFASFAMLSHLEASLKNRFARSACVFLACCMLLLGSVNALSLFRTGQAYPYAASDASELSKTKKKLVYASSPKFEDISEVPGLMELLQSGGKCLLFDTFSYPYYHFFGDDHCVQLDLAYDEEDLIKQAFSKDYDLYVIATLKEDTVNYEKARTFFGEHGYQAYETTSGLIFIK